MTEYTNRPDTYRVYRDLDSTLSKLLRGNGLSEEQRESMQELLQQIKEGRREMEKEAHQE